MLKMYIFLAENAGKFHRYGHKSWTTQEPGIDSSQVAPGALSTMLI